MLALLPFLAVICSHELLPRRLEGAGVSRRVIVDDLAAEYLNEALSDGSPERIRDGSQERLSCVSTVGLIQVDIRVRISTANRRLEAHGDHRRREIVAHDAQATVNSVDGSVVPDFLGYLVASRGAHDEDDVVKIGGRLDPDLAVDCHWFSFRLWRPQTEASPTSTVGATSGGER